MSRREARRRLQEADPNLTIVYGRRFPYAKRKDRVPKLLSDEEAEWLGLDMEGMFPIIPRPQVLHIEGKWSKIDLQNLCWTYGIDPSGFDKEVLVETLLWAGILDEDGELTGKEPRRK